MVHAALVFASCLSVGLGVDEASLLQANAGKKRLQTSSTAQWIEDFAQSPTDVVTRVANMLPSEQKSLLQYFASADASSLAKEIEPHKETLALVFRGSPVQAFAKGSPTQWVSALQHQTGEMESAIAAKAKPIRKKNDGLNSTSFPDSIEVKEDTYGLVGGRCRTGMEFDDLDWEAACWRLCDIDDGCESAYLTEKNNEEFGPLVCERYGPDHHDGSGVDGKHGISEEDTCKELCAMDGFGLCASSEVEGVAKANYVSPTGPYGTEHPIGYCKRFNWNMKTFKRSTLQSCGKRCSKYDDCVAFEWDNGVCELHDNSTDDLLSAEEAVGDENACYSKNATSSD